MPCSSRIGFTITTTTNGVTNANLASYNIVVVNLGSSWNSTYTAAEVTALNTFVQNERRTLILGKNTACPNGNINPVAQQFGVTCGVSEFSTDDLYLTNLQSGQPVFSGVDTVYMHSAGELTVTSAASLIARDANGKGAIAIALAGSGRVLVTGDINLFDDSYISIADNLVFAGNVFNWLRVGSGSAPVISVTAASLSDFGNVQAGSSSASQAYPSPEVI